MSVAMPSSTCWGISMDRPLSNAPALLPRGRVPAAPYVPDPSGAAGFPIGLESAPGPSPWAGALSGFVSSCPQTSPTTLLRLVVGAFSTNPMPRHRANGALVCVSSSTRFTPRNFVRISIGSWAAPSVSTNDGEVACETKCWISPETFGSVTICR